MLLLSFLSLETFLLVVVRFVFSDGLAEAPRVTFHFDNHPHWFVGNVRLGTSASLLVTSALLVVTMFASRNHQDTPLSLVSEPISHGLYPSSF